MMKVWTKNLNEDSIFYIFSNISKFQDFFEDIKYYFQFEVPHENIDFNDQNELSFFYYISFQYFLFKN